MEKITDGFGRFLPLVAIMLLGGAQDVLAKKNILEVCLSGCPYSSIQSAIDNAENGDEVVVSDGKYVENINFSGKAITVRSEHGPAVTVIDGNRNGSVVSFRSGEGSGSSLAGFRLVNGNGIDQFGRAGAKKRSTNPFKRLNLTFGGGIYCEDSSPVIIDCIIENNKVSGSGGGIYCHKSSPRIVNCITANNTASLGGGIYLENSLADLTNCIIYNNNAFSGSGISSIFSSPKITNCTISANTARKIGGGIYCYSSSPRVINSIFWGNMAGGSSSEIFLDNRNSAVPQEYISSTSVVYSDIMGGWKGEGNINADPLFVNAPEHDYRLRVDSPCIGSANSTSAPPNDIQGTPREKGVDMGAYEYKSQI